MSVKVGTEIVCPVCGKKFIKESSAQKHCSDKCRKVYHRKKPMGEILKEYKCAWCGKTFKYDRRKNYCSYDCRRKANGKRKNNRKKANVSLEEIAKRCREENLSYGQYVAKYGL